MRFLLLLLLLAWPTPARAGEVEVREHAQHLVMLLDYLAADYPRAVAAGRVREPAEYAEQQALLQQAQGLARGLPPRGVELTRPLARLQALVERKADGAEVAGAAGALRAAVQERYRVPAAPPALPSRSRGQALYAQACAACHGADGRARTPAAAPLRPPPTAFDDPGRLAQLSPFRAYNALTFGVQGTAMPAFDSLSEADRWDLASYLFTLRRPSADEALARQALEGAGLALGPFALATLTDGELLARLAGRGVAGEEADNALAWLRDQGAYRVPAATDLAAVRAGFAHALAAYQLGQRDEAQRALWAAYLEGYEPLEPTLRQSDPARVAQVEDAFSSLRAAVAAEQDGLVVARRHARLDALLWATQAGGPGAGQWALAALGLAAFAALGRLGRTPLTALLLAAALGHGVRALQEAGAVLLTPLPLPAGPRALGLYGSAEGLAAQGALLLALALSALWARRATAPRPSSAGAGSPAGP